MQNYSKQLPKRNISKTLADLFKHNGMPIGS